MLKEANAALTITRFCSFNIYVTPGYEPSRLDFESLGGVTTFSATNDPGDLEVKAITDAGSRLGTIRVALKDTYGNTVSSQSGRVAVELKLASPKPAEEMGGVESPAKLQGHGGDLAGVVSSELIDGVASFEQLRIKENTGVCIGDYSTPPAYVLEFQALGASLTVPPLRVSLAFVDTIGQQEREAELQLEEHEKTRIHRNAKAVAEKKTEAEAKARKTRDDVRHSLRQLISDLDNGQGKARVGKALGKGQTAKFIIEAQQMRNDMGTDLESMLQWRQPPTPWLGDQDHAKDLIAIAERSHGIHGCLSDLLSIDPAYGNTVAETNDVAAALYQLRPNDMRRVVVGDQHAGATLLAFSAWPSCLRAWTALCSSASTITRPRW